MICQPCRIAADNHLPHDGCDNEGRDYRGCACAHRSTSQGEQEQERA